MVDKGEIGRYNDSSSLREMYKQHIPGCMIHKKLGETVSARRPTGKKQNNRLPVYRGKLVERNREYFVVGSKGDFGPIQLEDEVYIVHWHHLYPR